ncbi:MAG: molybdopterin-synthase adenylyltransferase MoeB [Pseudomonadales bacterium]|nr:molybdopterin-synthase adenylyltransferase MoeB [Pseudomonadales bacterium]
MNDEQLLRYSRQIMLPELDIEGQEKLGRASVLIIGLGGLGSPAAIYLAASGIGEVTLVDDDVVDLSNLQRQIAHRESTIGEPKVASAGKAIEQISSETRINMIQDRLRGNDLLEALSHADVVVDATDNFESRYEINDACLSARTPFVSGAAIRMEGQVAVFDPRESESPCYRCLYSQGDNENLNCADNGVLAPVVGIIGTIQAMEAIKIISGIGETLCGHVLYMDAKRMEWHRLKLLKNPQCLSCGSTR